MDRNRAFGNGRAPTGSFKHFNKPRKDIVRFGSNKGRYCKDSLVIDEHIQEATPEHLRIEIDKILNEFLADPEKSEYIFPSDLNNLQRKYIHYKAQTMNLVSKSQGKEPNRQLHLKKKPKQSVNVTFQLNLSDDIQRELQHFNANYDEQKVRARRTRILRASEKVYGKLQDNEATIPFINKIDEEIAGIRRNLPIFDKRDTIIEAINQNQVVIICSETGSGKTTQIPQYIMEEAAKNKQACKIVCTQPRRISTIAAAERVAFERGESVGSAVGYQIRLEAKCSYDTWLIFCTVGVFLRNLMCGNDCLNNITHVIVDEIHERDKLSDFLLICLKQNLSHFPHLKVLLMSATVDTSKLQRYFDSSCVLSLPGRLHPIDTYFLEDVLSMTRYMTPQMIEASRKLERQERAGVESKREAQIANLPKQEQNNFDAALEAYLNFSENYDYTVHYHEATAELLVFFLSEGVCVDQQHSRKGYTALMIACQLGDVEFIGKLDTLGASFDVTDNFGRTAFDFAKLANKNNCLQLLSCIDRNRGQEKHNTNRTDPQFLRQLYDMTTPDDFIDYDLIVKLIKYVNANSDFGSILIFLPGYDEIMRCSDHIIESDLNPSTYRIFLLHSSMNMKDQCDVFKPLPNRRKFILSTNIAETSITVEDVVFVIDLGKVKEKVYDSYNKLSMLQTQWISRACAKQRQGRAGRVKAGFCFRLYSRQRFDNMSEERVPEMLRVSLEELCLHAKIIAPHSMNIYKFLCLSLDPPSANSVAVAVEHLQSLGALDKEEDLTRLGEYLAQLALEPRLGKMLLYGCIFRCLEPILTLGATMALKDPFQLPPQANLKSMAASRRQDLLAGVPSDHLASLLAFQRWQNESSKGNAQRFCRDYFISESTMCSIVDTRRQLVAQLRALGFVNAHRPIDEYNKNSESWGLIKAVMSASFFPNVAYPVLRGAALATRNEMKVSVHASSACASKKSFTHWCFFDEMMKNRVNFMIRGVTYCTPLMVAIMCGVDTIYTSARSVNLDDGMEFSFTDNGPINFRKAVQLVVDNAMMNPGTILDTSNLIVSDTLRKIMSLTELEEGFQQPVNIGVRPKFLFNIMHENPKKKAVITRENMGQTPSEAVNRRPPNEPNDHWMDRQRKGLTPKRFNPPQFSRASEARGSKVTKNLNFSAGHGIPYYGPWNESSLGQGFGRLSIREDHLEPSEALLKGLRAAQPNNSLSPRQCSSNFRHGAQNFDARPGLNDFNLFRANDFLPFQNNSDQSFDNQGKSNQRRRKYY